jgi:hypothetical protein
MGSIPVQMVILHARQRQVHTGFDRAVDRLYRCKPFADDAERVAMLLKMYQRLTATA